jgi:hypothetical protein
MVAPHTSAKNLTKFITDITGLEGYDIFSPNAAMYEQQEMRQTGSALEDEFAAEQGVDLTQ